MSRNSLHRAAMFPPPYPYSHPPPPHPYPSPPLYGAPGWGYGQAPPWQPPYGPAPPHLGPPPGPYAAGPGPYGGPPPPWPPPTGYGPPPHALPPLPPLHAQPPGSTGGVTQAVPPWQAPAPSAPYPPLPTQRPPPYLHPSEQPQTQLPPLPAHPPQAQCAPLPAPAPAPQPAAQPQGSSSAAQAPAPQHAAQTQPVLPHGPGQTTVRDRAHTSIHPPRIQKGYQALQSVARSALRPGAALALGEDTTAVVCPMCPAGGREPFFRLFFGRRIDGSGNAVPVTSLALPNDVVTRSYEDMTYNIASLAAIHRHVETDHPAGKYAVSADAWYGSIQCLARCERFATARLYRMRCVYMYAHMSFVACSLTSSFRRRTMARTVPCHQAPRRNRSCSRSQPGSHPLPSTYTKPAPHPRTPLTPLTLQEPTRRCSL